MAINPRDLAVPRYFYVYSVTSKRDYPILNFSIRESTGDEIASILFPMGGGLGTGPIASFRLAVWTYKDDALTLRRLFDGIVPAGSANALKRLLWALGRRSIPRYTQDPRTNTWIPWRYRHRAEDFIIARTLVIGKKWG